MTLRKYSVYWRYTVQYKMYTLYVTYENKIIVDCPYNIVSVYVSMM